MSRVGIIANPASGKDIRRLVAHGSTFDNNEKINIVRRVLLALDALGVAEVHYLPDTYAIVPRAAEGLRLGLALAPLPVVALGAASDSEEAARRLADLGAGCIVTLGGDGTNRVVAKGCGEVPLVPISTGTNNVFPTMVEGTLAGLAAGLVATEAVPNEAVTRRAPRLDVRLDGQPRDLALIDVITAHQTWIGARALWSPEQVGEVVLSRVAADAIGLCSLGGLLFPEACGGDHGAYVALGGEGRRVLAPLAPGLLRRVPVAAARLLAPGDRVALRRAPCVVALDGEREFEVLDAGHRLDVALNPAGPRVVDIAAALREGAARGVLADQPGVLS
ncbi:MAG TPA: NAD(+)/NADH kinase [Thermomicrobiales bacterium]|nr:NAD(+)/NADH kinase [Thermomicrobiales bacterium]